MCVAVRVPRRDELLVQPNEVGHKQKYNGQDACMRAESMGHKPKVILSHPPSKERAAKGAALAAAAKGGVKATRGRGTPAGAAATRGSESSKWYTRGGGE